jgi:hypothetical protein
MLGLAIMAAAVGDIDDRAKTFAIAYIAVRVLSDRVWQNEAHRRIVVDWRVAQIGAGTLPWLASLWVEEPWRYGLWALGLALDLVLTFTVSADQMAEGLSRRTAQPSRRGRRALTVSTAHLDTGHFGERLGLFTIIVLGEGVLVVVQAMAQVAVWDRALFLTVIGALALLAGLWALALQRGFGGIPFLTGSATTGIMVALASGMGVLVESRAARTRLERHPVAAVWLRGRVQRDRCLLRPRVGARLGLGAPHGAGSGVAGPGRRTRVHRPRLGLVADARRRRPIGG